jgi:hypothetical protein
MSRTYKDMYRRRYNIPATIARLDCLTDLNTKSTSVRPVGDYAEVLLYFT